MPVRARPKPIRRPATWPKARPIRPWTPPRGSKKRPTRSPRWPNRRKPGLRPRTRIVARATHWPKPCTRPHTLPTRPRSKRSTAIPRPQLQLQGGRAGLGESPTACRGRDQRSPNGAGGRASIRPRKSASASRRSRARQLIGADSPAAERRVAASRRAIGRGEPSGEQRKAARIAGGSSPSGQGPGRKARTSPGQVDAKACPTTGGQDAGAAEQGRRTGKAGGRGRSRCANGAPFGRARCPARRTTERHAAAKVGRRTIRPAGPGTGDGQSHGSRGADSPRSATGPDAARIGQRAAASRR